MKKSAASILLCNEKKEFLLSLRDNNKEINFPNHWTFPGGFLENTEKPEETIKREIKEEIEYYLKYFELFNFYDWKWFKIFVFTGKINLPISKLKLHEGQAIKFFNKEEVLKLNLAFYYNKVFREFINKQKL